MAIQVRRGALADYDESKMVAGEFAVTTDANDADQQVYVAFAPGDSKRILTESDITESTVQKIWTGTCTTASSTATKEVTLDNSEGFTLVEGVSVLVHFTHGNNVGAPKLNVNETGALSVGIVTRTISVIYTGTIPYRYWGPGLKLFTYNGTGWVLSAIDHASVDWIASNYAKKASPLFTGAPKAPTADPGTNTTQIATTEFVQTAIDSVSQTLSATEENGVVTLTIS